MIEKKLTNQGPEKVLPAVGRSGWSQFLDQLKKKKGFLILAAVLFLGLLTLVTASRGGPPEEDEEAPPSLTSPPAESRRDLSPYATDSAILETQAKLETISQELGQTNLDEASLNPPLLKWEADFEK